jgi:hypothetical protein
VDILGCCRSLLAFGQRLDGRTDGRAEGHGPVPKSWIGLLG